VKTGQNVCSKLVSTIIVFYFQTCSLHVFNNFQSNDFMNSNCANLFNVLMPMSLYLIKKNHVSENNNKLNSEACRLSMNVNYFSYQENKINKTWKVLPLESTLLLYSIIFHSIILNRAISPLLINLELECLRFSLTHRVLLLTRTTLEISNMIYLLTKWDFSCLLIGFIHVLILRLIIIMETFIPTQTFLIVVYC